MKLSLKNFNECFGGFTHQNMGNCFERCCGKLDKRKYLRTRYNVERDFSIEFENLMDDDNQQEEMANMVVLPEERRLLAGGQYQTFVELQKRVNIEVETELVRQEEELRMEEEAYYEAKREAARVAKIQKQKEIASKMAAGVIKNGPNAWLDDETEWDIAGGEDDFEMFLESVKARSLAARTRAIASQVPLALDQGSETSSVTRGERSHTEASSIDLEWEHEAGMEPITRPGKRVSVTEDNLNLAELMVKPSMLKEREDNAFTDLEWDNDFVASDEVNETRSLLHKDDDEADR